MARPQPLPNACPFFRVPAQEGYATSCDAVAALEEEHSHLNMKNVIEYLALRHAGEGYVGDMHLFTDSLASLHALHHDSPKDNIQLLSTNNWLFFTGTALQLPVTWSQGMLVSRGMRGLTLRLNSLVRGHESLLPSFEAPPP